MENKTLYELVEELVKGGPGSGVRGHITYRPNTGVGAGVVSTKLERNQNENPHDYYMRTSQFKRIKR